MPDGNIAVPSWLSQSATCLGTVKSSFKAPALTGSDIRAALLRPIWPDDTARTVFDIIQPGASVCLVVSDHTRKTAADIVLPILLTGLAERGCDPRDLSVLVASGIHRRTTDGELRRILGAIAYPQLTGRVFQHDPDDASSLADVGTTRRGHRVRVNRRALEADRLVLLGTASYHYHAGFGGGRKLLVPGLAARETIAFNHSLTLDPDRDRIHPGAAPGVLDGNPVAEEMMEGARLCKPDILINTVLDAAGRLIGLFSGDLDAAHRAACRFVEQVSRVTVRELADFVVASAEPAADWIQSHKALFNACRVVKDTGRIVLLAPCPEGLGNERFRYWIRKPTIEEMFRELRQSPEVNGQTALSTKTRGRRTILVTGLSPTDTADLGIRTAPDLDAACRLALDESAIPGQKPTFYLMPRAGTVVPFAET